MNETTTKKKKPASSKKFYAVVPVNFTYNDEIHYSDGYSQPTKLFKSKKKAEEACLKMSINTIIREPDFICSLGYDISEIVSDVDILEDRGISDFSGEEWANQLSKIVSAASTEELKKIVDNFKTSFYEVAEVIVED